MSLTSDAKASYTAIIDDILAKSNLESVSTKQIRKALQEKVDEDLTDRKDEVNNLIMERFTAAESKQDTGAKQNGDEDHSSPLSTGDSSVDAPRPKPKAEQASGDDDAAFAARLQAEENARGRTTRGTASGKRTTPKKAVKKKAKSVSKVKVTDDSDLESTNSGGAKIVNRSGAFHKPYTLSEPLAELCGETSMSRPQTVKAIWTYVKANNLQNPDDKRQIMCDDKLQAIFKTDTVHMFTMNKILSKHLYNDE